MLRNNEVMHQNVKCGTGVEPVDEAPIGLYTKFGINGTSEMDVMQKLHIGKLPNRAHRPIHLSTYGCLYQYHQALNIWATTCITLI